MIGILLGWLLHKTKDKKIHINNVFFLVTIDLKNESDGVNLSKVPGSYRLDFGGANWVFCHLWNVPIHG